jgi:hypothetical protein
MSAIKRYLFSLHLLHSAFTILIFQKFQESVEDVLNFIDVCCIALKSSGTAKTGNDKLLIDLEAKRKRITNSCSSFESSAPRAPPEGAPSQPNNETKSSDSPKEMNVRISCSFYSISKYTFEGGAKYRGCL